MVGREGRVTNNPDESIGGLSIYIETNHHQHAKSLTGSTTGGRRVVTGLSREIGSFVSGNGTCHFLFPFQYGTRQ